MFQTLRSDSGQRSSGERTSCEALGTEGTTRSAGLNLLTDDLSELFGRLRGLQAAVEADRRLNAPMPEQPPDRFIVPRSVLEINRGCRVSELVHGDPKSCRLFYALTKLRAECMRPLRLTVLARE